MATWRGWLSEASLSRPTWGRRSPNAALALVLGGFPAWLLLFSMVFLPTGFKPVKYALVVVVLLMVLAKLTSERTFPVHRSIIMLTTLYVVTGIAYVGEAYLNGEPGAVSMAPLFIAWPVVYTLLMSAVAEQRVLRAIHTVLLLSAIAVFIYSLLYVATATGLVPPQLLINLQTEANVGVYAGFIQIDLPTLQSALFLVPYLMASLIIAERRGRLDRTLTWIGLALGLAFVFLSLRRGVILAVAIAPIIIAFCLLLLPPAERARTMKRLVVVVAIMAGGLALVIAYATLVHGWTPTNYLAFFQSGFDFGGGGWVGASVRTQQFTALIDGWWQSPVVGSGVGAVVPSVVRDPTQPWAFELSYVDLLFETGVVGVIIYGSGLAWLAWMAKKVIQSGHSLGMEIIPPLVGLTSFLFANATNPYLAKFDFLWVLFLPIAYVNAWLLGRRPDQPEPAGRGRPAPISQPKPPVGARIRSESR